MGIESIRRPLAERLPILSRFRHRTTESKPESEIEALFGQAYSTAWDMANYEGITVVNDRIHEDNRVSVVTSLNGQEQFNTIWDVKKRGEIVTTELYLKHLSDTPQMLYIRFGFDENLPQVVIDRDIRFEEQKGKFIQKLHISKAKDMLNAILNSNPNKNYTHLSAEAVENTFNLIPAPHHREAYSDHAQPLSAPRSAPRGIFA